MEVKSVAELRPSMETVAKEIMNLLWDRRVHERVAGIIRSNDAVLNSAEAGNPFINGFRRWWAISSALVLRRHVDAGNTGTLRWIVEQLCSLEHQLSRFIPEGTASSSSHDQDLEVLEALSVRFRPFLNELIYGNKIGAPASFPTYNDLLEAIETLREIGERCYASILQVSMRLEPVEQFDWTDVFHIPWLLENADLAYELGTDGIPYDALRLTRREAEHAPRLGLRLRNARTNLLTVTISNDTEFDALDVRLFVPYMRTVFDSPEVFAGASAESSQAWLDRGDPKFGYGQAVLEFADAKGYIYRQYANVDVRTGSARDMTEPFRVKGRIVEPKRSFGT